MVAKRFELLHLTIPEISWVCKPSKLFQLESGALDRSAKQPLDLYFLGLVTLIYCTYIDHVS